LGSAMSGRCPRSRRDAYHQGACQGRDLLPCGKASSPQSAAGSGPCQSSLHRELPLAGMSAAATRTKRRDSKDTHHTPSLARSPSQGHWAASEKEPWQLIATSSVGSRFRVVASIGGVRDRLMTQCPVSVTNVIDPTGTGTSGTNVAPHGCAGRGWWNPMSDAKGDVFNLVQRLDPALRDLPAGLSEPGAAGA
jgi:hypothetical protein